VLIRFDRGEAQVLMGQRPAGQAFMPNKFVFPGGRLEAADSRKPCMAEAATVEKLMLRMRGKAGAARARAIMVAAIRETYEETGLMFGHSAAGAPYDTRGISYFARAITPPGRTRRFDSRFLVADARHLTNLDDPHPLPDLELLKISWVTFSQARALDLPTVTRDVLDLLHPLVAAGRLPDAACPVSFFYRRGKYWQHDQITLAET
jgi:8-oxo-dGTP pyrophosphatase MutT (NUDIX family)